jgi:hypothetical protein
MSHDVLQGCRPSCLVIPDTLAMPRISRSLSFLQDDELFSWSEEETLSTRNFCRGNLPPSLLSLFLDSALLQYLPGHRERRLSIELQYWSPAHRCAHYAMSPPAMAPVLGSGTKEYKRESGTARLLGSGIYAQCELEQDSEI